MIEKYKKKIEGTKVSIIKVETSVNKNMTLTQSKLSGVPYWSEDKDFPMIDNIPMKLMWQLNFEEFSQFKTTLDIPKEGILQCYLDSKDDGLLGLTFDGSPSKLKYVYHSDISKKTIEFSKEQLSIFKNNDNFISEKSLEFIFSQSEELLGLGDEIMVKKHYDFFSELSDKEIDCFYEENTNEGSKIGGYAYFTQQDPRVYIEESEDYILLFQIDSDDNLMWGDSGVGNWFIKLSDLKNKNFNNILYNWDCC